jgi:hypothetical protein
VRWGFSLFIMLVGLLTVGCGSGSLKPKGQLMKKGAPFVPAEGEVVHVMLFAEDDKADEQAYNVEVDSKDGSFKVVGIANKGIPPGKYRATVQLMKNRKDVFDGAYGRTRTPFHVDVKSSSDVITLDLDTPGQAATPTRGGGIRRDRAR